MDGFSPGHVALVGAGPGDPGLLTLRGRDLLAGADVVLYDRLANPLLLSYAPGARLIHVGKEPDRHPVPQDRINAMLVAEARAGRRVVRLKGGDPFIFGRGGEECAALADAQIPFEVVPGVTAGMAASAYAGIPLTHRDFNSSVTFVTGHDADGKSDAPPIDWSALAKLPCLVFYMGIGSLRENCKRLIDAGMPPSTPAACVQWGTTARQHTVVADVATLPDAIAHAGLGSPAITLIGPVVQLCERLSWFESRPLFGQRIVVTRTGPQHTEQARLLTSLGADVIEAPLIAIAPPDDVASADAALQQADQYDWIVFTSAAGVTHTRDRLMAMGADVRALGQARIAAVGRATADAVRQHLALRVDLCPVDFTSDALLAVMDQAGAIAGQRFLLLRGNIASPSFPQQLHLRGAAKVSDVVVYQTKEADAFPPALVDAWDSVTWITFASGSAAKAFAAQLRQSGRSLSPHVRLASIGPVTSAALRSEGLTPTVEAHPHTLAGLVDAILTHARQP